VKTVAERHRLAATAGRASASATTDDLEQP